MKSFNYNLLAEYLTLRFRCPECEEEIITDALSVPAPNYMAEKASESETYEEYEINCPHCEEWNSQVVLYTRIDGGYGEIEDLDSNIPVEIEVEMPNPHEEMD